MFRILFLAIVLLLFTSAAARATENLPGSSCAGYTANSWQWAGGPENGGLTSGMFCNGGTNLWTGVINFQSSGNVGIGTTTPAAKLDISTIGSAASQLRFEQTSSTGHYWDIGRDNAVTGDLLVLASGTERLRITSIGNVGIGTTSPAAPLHVKGEAIVGMNALACSGTTAGGIRYNSGTSKVQFCNSLTWADVSSPGAIGSNTQIAFNNSGTETGSANLTWSGTVLAVTGDINYSGLLKDLSDRRVKDDIQPLPSGQLRKLMQIQPVSFVMKSDPRHRTELGVIAQDAEPLYPELVETGTDGIKSMAYVGLVAPMIEAMQEQQAEINQLRAMLAVMLLGGLFFLWRNHRTAKMR